MGELFRASLACSFDAAPGVILHLRVRAIRLCIGRLQLIGQPQPNIGAQAVGIVFDKSLWIEANDVAHQRLL